MFQRPDLNGLRLQRESGPDVWLIFNGKLHKIRSPAVYINLFKDDNDIVWNDDIDFIDVAPALENGSCLVQGLEERSIYLLAKHFDGAQLYKVSSWETFIDFGFDQSKVLQIPDFMLNMVSRGHDLTSAADIIRKSTVPSN